MKKILILAILALCAFSATAQQRKEYCCVTAQYAHFSGKMVISVDYGADELKDNHLVNEKGERMQFYSFMAVLNYMSKSGWELETYRMNVNDRAAHFAIMSRNVPEKTEGDEQKN